MKKEDILKTIELVDVIDTLNSLLYVVTVGDEFEIEEIGEDSDEYNKRYQEYSKMEIKFKHEIDKNEDKTSIRCALKIDKVGIFEIKYEECYRINFIPRGAWNRVFKKDTLKEAIEEILSCINQETFPINLEDFVDNMKVNENLSGRLKNFEKLSLLGDTLTDYDNNFSYYISDYEENGSSCTSMSIRSGKYNAYLSAQTHYKDNTKYRIWRIIEDEKGRRVEERITDLEGAGLVVEELFIIK